MALRPGTGVAAGTGRTRMRLAAPAFALTLPLSLAAQTGTDQCSAAPKASWCAAVPGDRAEAWLSQHRSEVMARNGIVATSQPLAAQAGLEILRQGGNAIDAAVATAAVLSVVEPMMVGPAGDLFAIVYIARENKVYALDASGTAPRALTPEHLAALGYAKDTANWGPASGMPVHGILPVTTPGAVWGWDAILRRFGTRTFRAVLAPAIMYAEEGFPVSERTAHDWILPRAIGGVPSDPRQCCTALDPASVATWYVDGKPPVPGQVVRNPGLARTFRLLQQQGISAFYRGPIARAIVARSRELGGVLTLEDLATYRGEWVTPARSSYHGYDLFTLPPPSQAWATGEMLNILEACLPGWAPGVTLASLGPASPAFWHLMVEAKKLAYADLYRYNADPAQAKVPLDRLLSPGYAASLCGRVSSASASSTGRPAERDGRGDTIVLTTADRWGNMVAWVNSLASVFGSGITVGKYGLALHNRGVLFSLDPASPNVLAPGKRPFNTLSAAFVMKDNRPLMTVTLMGGDMQAQGMAQVLVNVLDLGANMQSATDMARFRHSQVPNRLWLESRLDSLVGDSLRALGHDARRANGDPMGGCQSIMFVPDSSAPVAGGRTLRGYYRAGSDHRKDGAAVGY